MATLLPDLQGHKLPKGVAPICSRLRQIDCEDLVCRLALPISGQPLPEFFLLYKEHYAFLVSVSNLTTRQITEQLHGDLFSKADDALFREEFGLRERQLLDDCYELLATHGTDQPQPELHLNRWVLFPHASRAILDQVIQVLDDPDYTLVAKEECSAAALLRRITAEALTPALESTIHRMREIYRSAELSPKAQATKAADSSQQHDIFLDLNQEALIKTDFDLSGEGRSIVEAGSRLVTGAAGSGKSLILIHRAKLLAEMDEQARILVLTHNRPLNGYLSARFGHISQRKNITWKTFFSWITGQHRSGLKVIHRYACEALISELLNQSPLAGKLPSSFLIDEFQWITDNDCATHETYLQAARTGRKRPLGPAARTEVHQLYSQYQQTLAQRGQSDWSGLAHAFLTALRSDQLVPERYDAIFIDEAQFFVPVWFECVRRALKPNGQLFMAADPTQGFLGSGQSWQQISGFDIRGKSHCLTRPYRNSRAILDFAVRFYRSRVPTDDERIHLPDTEDMIALRPGLTPEFMRFSSAQDQTRWIAKRVAEAIQRGEFKASQVLLLHEDRTQTENLIRLINKETPHLAAHANDAQSHERIRVASINAATGLEAPVVFLLGLDRIFEAENDLQADPTDTTEQTLRNTRKIYMVLTRAMERLVICHLTADTKRSLCGECSSTAPSHRKTNSFLNNGLT